MKPVRLLAVWSTFALAGCGIAGSAEPKDEAELQTYAVPAGNARDIRNALNVAFGWAEKDDGPQAKGRVSLAPDGRLIVLAPAKLQQGVASLIEELGRTPPTSLATVEMQYWLVLGSPGEAERDPRLEEIKAALDEVSKAQAVSRFKLLQSARVTSSAGDGGEVTGQGISVRQSATVSGSRIVGDLRIMVDSFNELRTNVQIAAGQTIVLGQSGYPGKSEGKGAEETTLYYVIRAHLRDAPDAQR